MVHHIDNHVDDQERNPGFAWEIPVLLLGAFRSMVDDANAMLEDKGFPGVRPAHGFALQALGAGASASELGARLGVSKQAAAKTVALLEEGGYVDRADDPADGRRKVIVPNARGRAMLDASAEAFAVVAGRWAEAVGHAEMAQLHTTLRALNANNPWQFDLSAWSG